MSDKRRFFFLIHKIMFSSYFTESRPLRVVLYNPPARRGILKEHFYWLHHAETFTPSIFFKTRWWELPKKNLIISKFMPFHFKSIEKTRCVNYPGENNQNLKISASCILKEWRPAGNSVIGWSLEFYTWSLDIIHSAAGLTWLLATYSWPLSLLFGH